MAQEEIMMRFSILEQQSNQLGEQIQAVEKKIRDLELLKENLNNIKDNKDKEILAHIGDGIFIKSEIKEKSVLINIGSKIIIKKEIPEARGIIGNQIERLDKLRLEIIKGIERVNAEIQKTILEAEKESN